MSGPGPARAPSVGAERSIYRKEAWEFHQRGAPEQGDVLLLSPFWGKWTYRVLVGLLGAGLVFCNLASVNEYASGPALVRVERRTDMAVPAASIVATVEVQPGQQVTAGQTLVTFVANDEHGALARIDREFELQLVRVMRDLTDTAARQSLTALRAERELAQARLEARALKAPFSGIVGDLRIQPGQYLTPGVSVLSLVETDAPVYLLAFLPGYYRPYLQPGMPLRIEFDGFKQEYHELSIEAVGDQVIGPNEVRRYLGPELSDAVPVEGPVVLVRARVPSNTFVTQGKQLRYFDGMPAHAEARVREESTLALLIPGLKRFLHHDG